MKDGVDESFGEAMYDAFKDGADVMPQICDDEDELPPELMTLINAMTSYEQHDRPTSVAVHETLLKVSVAIRFHKMHPVEIFLCILFVCLAYCVCF